MSNLDHRKDIRSVEKFKYNLKKGQEREAYCVSMLQDWHDRACSISTDIPLEYSFTIEKASDCNYHETYQYDKGDYSFSTVNQLTKHSVCNYIIDVKCQAYDSSNFRLKKLDVERCINNQWSIIICNRLESANPRIGYLSGMSLMDMYEFMSPVFVPQFGNKLGYILNEDVIFDICKPFRGWFTFQEDIFSDDNTVVKKLNNFLEDIHYNS